MMRHRLYWTFVCLGFLAVVVAVWSMRRREGFEDVATTTATTVTAGDNVEVQEGAAAIATMPRKDRLKLYLSSFMEPSTYNCQANAWCDSQNPAVKYFLMTSTLPPSIKPNEGLAIQNVRIRGPAAYTLSSAQANYVMGSFTVAFYARTLDLEFGSATRIVLLDIPAQTPNRLTVFVSKDARDANKVHLHALVGSVTDEEASTYTWTFPDKTSLLDGDKLLALTFDKAAGKITLFSGTASQGTLDVAATNRDITLGVTELQINKLDNWNARLYAFAFYDTALTGAEVEVLNTYFTQHVSGFAMQVRAKDMLEDEIRDLMGKVQSGEDTIKALLDKINTTTCPTDAAKKNPQSATVPPKWLIKMGASADGVSTVELGKCSPLHVRSFGEPSAEEEIGQEEEAAPETTPADATVRTARPKRVAYPPHSVRATTVAQPVEGAEVANPSQPKAGAAPKSVTATTATPTASSTTATKPSTTEAPMKVESNAPSSQDPDFWSKFFTFMKEQQAKNDAIASGETTTTPKDAYDALRDQVTTDRTRPGNPLFSQTVAQDPARPADAPEAAPATRSWWDAISDVFLK
jgi:hypothetical protein